MDAQQQTGHGVMDDPNSTALPQAFHGTGKIPFRMYEDSKQVSQAVAAEIASLIKERAAAGKTCVLGLATGSTPVNVYSELVRLHRDEGLSLANVITFNLDEYFPMQQDCLQSYVRFMREHLFDHVNIAEENIHIPDGTIAVEQVADWCRQYEAKIDSVGGIDVQLLGICLLYTSPSPRDRQKSRMPSSA